jgi:hypothetical protein
MTNHRLPAAITTLLERHAEARAKFLRARETLQETAAIAERRKQDAETAKAAAAACTEEWHAQITTQAGDITEHDRRALAAADNHRRIAEEATRALRDLDEKIIDIRHHAADCRKRMEAARVAALDALVRHRLEAARAALLASQEGAAFARALGAALPMIDAAIANSDAVQTPDGRPGPASPVAREIFDQKRMREHLRLFEPFIAAAGENKTSDDPALADLAPIPRIPIEGGALAMSPAQRHQRRVMRRDAARTATA